VDIPWSPVQRRRLEELGAGEAGQPPAGAPGQAGVLEARFPDEPQRDAAFQELEKRLVKAHRAELAALQRQARPPALCRLERSLCDRLAEAGFTRVATPTLMSRGALARMGIRPGTPLHDKIFWVDQRRCLRPMLAPHLYSLLVELLRVWEKPVRIFEVGSCFRRETQGAQHAAEFTMLNLCEMGLPQEQCRPRLEELAALLMRAAGIEGWSLQSEDSVVYGQTVDLVAAGVELGSAAMGPHELDRPWRIAEPWVGIGLGLERLAMVAEGGRSLAPWGRSLSHLDGRPLRV
jgi:pyrrolysyl-tRNA synthetase-like protein